MQYLTQDKILFLAKNFYYGIMIFWDAVQDSFYGALLNFVHSLWVGGEWSWFVLCERKFFMSRTYMHACILCMRAYMQHVYKYRVIYTLVLACTHVHQLTHGAFTHPTTHKYWTSKHKKAFACFFDHLSHLVYLLCLLQDWKLYVPLEEYYTFVNSIEARYNQYHIAGNFWGRKFSWISRKVAFCGENFRGMLKLVT